MVNIRIEQEKKKKRKHLEYKAIIDFKARVLKFISIYIKEQGANLQNEQSIMIIQGLLKALDIADKDKNTMLFERIKKIIIQIAKEGKKVKYDASIVKGQDSDPRVMLFTEIISKIVK